MIDVVFDASIAEVLDDHMEDQRLKDALFGQGIIGAWAGPHDKGTARIKLMHYQGDLEGGGPLWGYVRGGMGMISFAIADAAQEAGATLAAGVPVAEIVPEEGVRLEDGTLIRATTVVCNADPKVALRLLGDHDVPPSSRERLDRLAAPQPGGQVQRRARPPPRLDRRPRPGLPRPRHRRRHHRPRRGAARVRALRAQARPPSASARSTSRPSTTRAPRRPAATSSASSASTRPTTSTGTTGGTRSPASSST